MSRRPNKYLQEAFSVTFNHAAITANQTNDVWSVPSGRTAVIDRVLYVNPTGLAASDTDYVIIKALNAALVAAQWSTKTTGGDGALVAGTQAVPAVSATAANISMAAGTKLKFSVAVTGTPTLPIGSFRVEGRLL